MKKILSLAALLCLPLLLQAQEQFSVYFDSNKYELKKSEADKLQEWMIANKESKILAINGYTDEDGTTGYNDSLAQRRVSYVFNLVKDKVKARDDFRTRSFGEQHNQSTNKAENRKVTLYYLQKKDLSRENEILGITAQPVKRQPVKYPEKVYMPKPDGTKEEVVLDKEIIAAIDAAKPGDIIRLKNINFYENSFGVLPESGPRLFELLTIMQANKNLKIKIQGHICCMEGDPRDLSTKRAKQVMEFLNKNGIEKNRLSFEGLGTTKPINPLPEKNEAERAENRRVEIMIVEN
jgi:outer membrane protein OmpA-like peptidoglycan-associated protein